MICQGCSGEAFACRVFLEAVYMLDHGARVSTEEGNSDKCFFFELILIDLSIDLRKLEPLVVLLNAFLA